jgi:hypothetical protein
MSGPENQTPGPEVWLTPDQLTELRAFVPSRHHGSIRLRDAGGAWLHAELFDADGERMDTRLLPPTLAQDSHRSKLRLARELRAGAEADRESHRRRD